MNKEELKAKRKEAYQKAKAVRDNDPVYLAKKERARLMRKEQYRAFRNKIKEEKLADKKALQKARDEEIAKAAGLFEQLRLLKFE